MGARIRRLRDQRGWSQYVLADKVGVTQAGVSAWEQGHRVPKWPELRALAEVFGIDPNWITAPLLEGLPPNSIDPGEGSHDPDPDS